MRGLNAVLRLPDIAVEILFERIYERTSLVKPQGDKGPAPFCHCC